jgi:DNA-binding response OmpR family regulator
MKDVSARSGMVTPSQQQDVEAQPASTTLRAMTSRIMVIADEPWTRNEVHAALTEPDYTLIDHDDPTTTSELLSIEQPDAVVIDLQVGSMGGMAIARDLHQRAAMADTDGVPVVLLLDRQADSFLAKRSGVAAWVTKPFTAHDIRTAVESAIAG